MSRVTIIGKLKTFQNIQILKIHHSKKYASIKGNVNLFSTDKIDVQSLDDRHMNKLYEILHFFLSKVTNIVRTYMHRGRNVR